MSHIYFTNLGNNCFDSGEYKKAFDYYKKGLECSAAIGDKRRIVDNLINLGNACCKLGDYKKAIEFYKKGLKISTEICYLLGIANNNSSLGQAFLVLGEYKEAIDFCKKGLDLSTKVCDESGILNSNMSLGNVYFKMGEYEKARDYYNKCLETSTAMDDQTGIANSKGSLSNVYRQLEGYEKANNFSKKSLETCTAFGDRTLYSLSNSGNDAFSSGEYEKAIDYYKKSLDMCTAMGEREEIATNNCNLGNAYLRLGKYQEAVRFYEKSLEIFTAIGDRSGIAKSNGSLGNIYRQMKKFKKASFYSMTSIKDFDKMFLRSVPDQNKLSFTTQYFKAYEDLMCCFISLDRIESALLVKDLGRAKELHCQIERKHDSEDMSSYARVMWNRIDNNEELIEIEKTQEILHVGQDTSILVFAFDLEGILNVWILNGKVIFRTLKLDGNLEKIAWLINKLLGKVHVNVNRESSFYKLDSDTVPHTQKCIPMEIPSGEPELKKTVKSSVGDNSNPEILKQLFKLLIDPVRDVVKGNKLIIVPDKPLFFVPFPSLIDENDFYLSNSYSIQITPSLHTLTSSISHSHDANLGYALFVGNPTVGKVILNRQELAPGDLPFAGEEVKYLSKLFKAMPLLGPDATKQKVLERLGGASVIHIAAHGEPNKGEIMLAPNPSLIQPCLSSSKPDSYLLRQGDIENISVQAHLVVLCCCHTGQGEVSSEGVIGIARAFLAAGARSVLAALWPISDHDTKKFMEKFYDEIFLGTSVCEALRRTMNLFQTRGESFEVWAPFTIYGEDVKFSKHEIEEITKSSFMSFLADFLNFYNSFLEDK